MHPSLGLIVDDCSSGGGDFQETTIGMLPLEVSAEQRTERINFTICSDNRVEDNETFQVHLLESVMYVTASTDATVIITDSTSKYSMILCAVIITDSTSKYSMILCAHVGINYLTNFIVFMVLTMLSLSFRCQCPIHDSYSYTE